MNEIYSLKVRLVCLLFLIIYFSLLLPASLLAQRDLFNVPTVKIVEKNKFYFQQEFEVTDQIKSGTTLTYGLGSSWEIGLNITQLTINYEQNARIVDVLSLQPESNPHLLINIQKGIHVTDWLNIGIGTSTGASYINKLSNPKIATFSYLNNQFSIPQTEIKLIGGGYYSNQTYVGKGNDIGYLLGASLPLIKEKLNFQGEYISGTHSQSYFTTGLALKLPSQWQLAAGALYLRQAVITHMV